MRRLLHVVLVLVLATLVLPPLTTYALSWPIVKRGQTGANVTTVQHLLTARGVSTAADGDFGPATEDAVKRFQASRGLTTDGIVGPNTWSALIVTVNSGDTGSAVKAAQVQLNKYGYGLGVDGDFGPATDRATRDFQSKHSLAVDGDIGPNTWSALTSGGTAPSSDRAALAARIRDSSRVSLLTYHVSGISDPASTARQNIVDTANGLPAKTSSYSDVGRTNVYLNVSMLQGMVSLANTYSYRVTEIAGGDHSSTSRHYAGVAFDVDLINGASFSSRTATVSAFMQACRNLGATEVLGPGDAGHSTHVHCGWPR